MTYSRKYYTSVKQHVQNKISEKYVIKNNGELQEKKKLESISVMVNCQQAAKHHTAACLLSTSGMTWERALGKGEILGLR